MIVKFSNGVYKVLWLELGKVLEGLEVNEDGEYSLEEVLMDKGLDVNKVKGEDAFKKEGEVLVIKEVTGEKKIGKKQKVRTYQLMEGYQWRQNEVFDVERRYEVENVFGISSPCFVSSGKRYVLSLKELG